MFPENRRPALKRLIAKAKLPGAAVPMAGNWEGMGIGPAVEKSFGIPRPHLMLPLPQETTDGK